MKLTSHRTSRRLRPRGLVAVGLAVASVAVLAACAPASTDGVVSAPSGSSSAAPDSGTTLADVQKAGKLVIGTEGTYKPFSFHADGSGQLTGYDIDVVTAVAEKLGVTPEFQETQWDAIFAGLDAGRFDLIANQVSINPERQAKYDFSTPYTVSHGVVIVPASNTDITSLASLSGKTTAQSQSSNWYQTAKDAGATVQVVDGWAQSIALLEQGRIDATVNDELTFLDYQKTDPSAAAAVKVGATTDDVSESAFTAVKGSDSLIKAIDQALAELKADGTLASISDKYFGSDVSE
ncbi:amino acid ABC transporter substrate-binding protein [Frigoribacterium sp. 2-23]|uniref:amino acid ABC transporter substrate-binding protein n=1 Tax=Frigoribacterium sp. 2-23 TaxID=3415006 RepID=UPI003C6EC21C